MIEAVIAAVGVLLAFFSFRLGVKSNSDGKFATLHKRATEIEAELHEFREEVAKDYPSRRTLQDTIISLEKNIQAQFRAQQSDMRLIVSEEIDKAIQKT